MAARFLKCEQERLEFRRYLKAQERSMGEQTPAIGVKSGHLVVVFPRSYGEPLGAFVYR